MTLAAATVSTSTTCAISASTLTHLAFLLSSDALIGSSGIRDTASNPCGRSHAVMKIRRKAIHHILVLHWIITAHSAAIVCSEL